jgi:hypothetical protein
METYNLLVERRKELQELQRNGQGLDRIAAVQRQAEAAQNSLDPVLEGRLRRAKDEVEQQKRLNVKLQADRQKLAPARKQAEQEVRSANCELRSKAAQLQRPPRAPSNPVDQSSEDKHLRQLRRDSDILSEALRQDERKFKSSEREASQDFDMARMEKLQADVAAHEAEIVKLNALLASENHSGPSALVECGAHGYPPVLPASVNSSPCQASQPALTLVVQADADSSCQEPEVDVEESDDMSALVAPT